jgi:hypothetical protein
MLIIFCIRLMLHFESIKMPFIEKTSLLASLLVRSSSCIELQENAIERVSL